MIIITIMIITPLQFAIICSLLYIEIAGVLKHMTLYKKLTELAQQSLLAAKHNALNFISMRPTARPVTVSGGPSKLAMKSYRPEAEKLAAKSYRPPTAPAATTTDNPAAATVGSSVADKLNFKSYSAPVTTMTSGDGDVVDNTTPAPVRRPSLNRQKSIIQAAGEAYLETMDDTTTTAKENVVDEITHGNSAAKAKIMELLKQIEKDHSDDSDSDSDSDDDNKED